uniref:RRM domain-containing protein n=1 Tax=Caenorhabditis tropicalis TaxID=1561998 RepID=A0A1I7T2G2_9PELO
MVAHNLTSISVGGQKTPQKTEKVQKKPQKKIWVVKLQRIPFGFFEKELLGYFRQFGNVLRIRVARSRKTGNHKGWAYVGFDNKAVAEIAAESMNGYLMFEQRLGCKVMKPSLIPKSMLKGPLLVVRPSYLGLAKKDAIARNNATTKNDVANSKNRLKHLKKTITKLQNMGIDYDFPVSGIQKALSKKADDNDVQIIGSATPSTPKKSTPKVAQKQTPKVATPKAVTPKAGTPKAVTPKAGTPKPNTTKSIPTPKTTPIAATKKVVIKTPQTEKVKLVEKTPKFSPKTRAAKAAALGTPQVKSTLSKTILKSVTASARPAAVEKKPLKTRGKKKSL